MLCISRGTTHECHADTPHIVGCWLNWRMRKLPPVVASRINNHLILDFLQKHIGIYRLFCSHFILELSFLVVIKNVTSHYCILSKYEHGNLSKSCFCMCVCWCVGVIIGLGP